MTDPTIEPIPGALVVVSTDGDAASIVIDDVGLEFDGIRREDDLLVLSGRDGERSVSLDGVSARIDLDAVDAVVVTHVRSVDEVRQDVVHPLRAGPRP